MSSLAQPVERRWSGWLTILLLLFGWMIFGVGEVAGLILLLSSDRWYRREKWIGALIPVWLGMIVLSLVLGSSTYTCSTRAPCVSPGMTVGDGFLIALAIASFIAAIGSAIVLARRLN
jgi:hypothetical protein